MLSLIGRTIRIDLQPLIVQDANTTTERRRRGPVYEPSRSSRGALTAARMSHFLAAFKTDRERTLST